MKHRDPIAKSLRSPHLRNQVVPDKRREKLEELSEQEILEELCGDYGIIRPDQK